MSPCSACTCKTIRSVAISRNVKEIDGSAIAKRRMVSDMDFASALSDLKNFKRAGVT